MERYEESLRKGTKLVDLNQFELAGYFIRNYRNNPVNSLRTYRSLHLVAFTTGSRTEQILLSLGGETIVS